jgi:SAM-dependent methyltransferase
MHEILSSLQRGSAVLDLGSGSGSFDAQHLGLFVVRADIAVPQHPSRDFVACDSARLPFADHFFSALILNHSLEHFEDAESSIREIGRVLSRSGFLYVAVPDSTTLTDRIYRWLGRGGGHVNQFSDVSRVPELIVAATGLAHVGTRTLCTSLSFLNNKNFVNKPPMRTLLFLNGSEPFLRLLTFALRRLDRWFHWRTSIYGWAYYFGQPVEIDTSKWSNVCIRCGTGHPLSELNRSGKLCYRKMLPPVYRCGVCGTANFFTQDE